MQSFIATKEEIHMARHVLVISTSLRNNSNSDRLADSFAEGAKAAGNEVTKISLMGKKIAFCKGCLACQKLGHCVIADDALAITEEMCKADVIVWATPIYYYEMSGQMKTMIDRANSLYSADYKFRDIYFLSSAAEDEDGVDARAISGLEGWIACFDRVRLAGTVFAGGVNDPGDIAEHPSLQKAYEMGKNI